MSSDKNEELFDTPEEKNLCRPDRSEMGYIRQYRAVGLKWKDFCSPGDISSVWRHCWLFQEVQGWLYWFLVIEHKDAVKTSYAQDGSPQQPEIVVVSLETLIQANCCKK